MTVGISSTEANILLGCYRGSARAGVTLYLKLHTGDPGAAGTANASAVRTRNAITFAAASGGSMALSSMSDYSMTTSETITHGSLWTDVSAGTFVRSAALTASVPVVNGTTLHFTGVTLSYTPVAA